MPSEALERVGLADAARRRVGGYSGGMRQRLGIAQAIVARPRLLILDEPVSSLDPEGRRDLLTLIAELRADATVIFSTHVLSDIERVCDRVAILDHGHLVTKGPSRTCWRVRPAALPDRTRSRTGRGGRPTRRDASRDGWVERVDDVGGHGDDRIVVSVADEAAAAAGLLPLIAAAGVRVAVFERVRPTLEDVFLRLVGRATPTTWSPGEPPRAAAAQGTARIVANVPAADRGRAVPVRRVDLAAPREVPPGDPQGGGR